MSLLAYQRKNSVFPISVPRTFLSKIWYACPFEDSLGMFFLNLEFKLIRIFIFCPMTKPLQRGGNSGYNKKILPLPSKVKGYFLNKTHFDKIMHKWSLLKWKLTRIALGGF